MLGETENQFSLTRAGLGTCGRAKSKFYHSTCNEFHVSGGASIE